MLANASAYRGMHDWCGGRRAADSSRTEGVLARVGLHAEGLDEPDEFRDRSRPHLLHYLVAMGLHGAFGDAEAVGDFFVGQTLDHLHDNFSFSACQLNIRTCSHRSTRRTRTAKILARPQRLAVDDTANALQKSASTCRVK